jgi:RNA polymerase sigma-70 factor (ECF subfamily)
MPTHSHQTLQALLKQQQRRVVAHLARSLGLVHLALAEDAVQTAALRALEVWPAQGVPANPAGWLYRVARHEAIDALRAAGRHDSWPEEDDDAAEVALPRASAPAGRLTGELDDDELALLFCACHPKLPAATQVALALRAMAGLDLGTIAAGLLCSEAALAQRLARARDSLSADDLHWPAGHELPARREAVLTTLSLAFHAGARARARSGATAAAGPALAQTEGSAVAPNAHPATALCWESIRLARALAAHPAAAHPEADALAALLLLHGARLSGQLDDAGHIVLLPGQPRDRWDGGLVRLGLAHLQAAQRGTALSRWHLLAGIAAEHAVAPNATGTNWPAIARYYQTLLQLDPTAAPRLGHAIAHAEAGEPAQALQWLQALQPELPSALRAHGLAAQARAHERLGQCALALQLLHAAAEAASHPAEARALRHRADELEADGRHLPPPAAPCR